jgi:hypothetical protein
LLCLVSPARAQCPATSAIFGQHAYDEYGGTVAGGTDINNDGYADFIVGAEGWDSAGTFGSKHGRVYVYSGIDQSLLTTIEPPVESSISRFGRDLDTLGDVNGDGYGDFIVGARYWNDTGGVQYGEGVAMVFSGIDYSPIHILEGDSIANGMGGTVACIGDITKDGVNDFLAGGWAGSGYDSRIAIFNGATGSEITAYSSSNAADRMGIDAAGVGDLDGDTYPDFVIAISHWDGLFTDEGRVNAYSGKTFQLLWSVTGDTTEAYLGTSVSGAGDVNGDGYTDVICGSHFGVNPGSDNPDGFVLVVSGLDGSVIRKQVSPIFNAREFGYAVSGLGDVDRDGYGDYAVGDPAQNVGSGGYLTFSGFDGSEIKRLPGSGTAVAAAGDIDGNGTPDMLFGAYRDNTNGTLAGLIRIQTCNFPDSACRVGPDFDNDGWNDDCDNCPFWTNKYQLDSDSNGIGDQCTDEQPADVGADVQVWLNYGVITFDSVTAGGSVTIEQVAEAPPPGGAFQALPQGNPIFYNIESSVGFDGLITVCLNYDQTGMTPAQEDSVQIFHHNGSVWEALNDQTLDTGGNEVCGTTASLSPFGMGLPMLVSVEEDQGLRPTGFSLRQNYPNPFNPRTTVVYLLDAPSHVTVTVFDLLGRQVRALVNGAMPAGTHYVTWNGQNDSGVRVASGVYFYRLQVGQRTEVRKMLLLR